MWHAALTLAKHHTVVRQVLLHGGMMIAFERDQGALVGSHTEVDTANAPQLAPRMEALARRWAAAGTVTLIQGDTERAALG